MVRSIKDVRSLTPVDVLNSRDTFFSLVSFDPNNSRLASVQGEIRVGPSYQVNYLLKIVLGFLLF